MWHQQLGNPRTGKHVRLPFVGSSTSITSCFDIVHSDVCLYMHDYWEPHFLALKRIAHYVRGTLDHGLQLFSSFTTSLVAFSDVDWAGCPTTRRSTTELFPKEGTHPFSKKNKDRTLNRFINRFELSRKPQILDDFSRSPICETLIFTTNQGNPSGSRTQPQEKHTTEKNQGLLDLFDCENQRRRKTRKPQGD
nr:ribonuclease H-like domain-containing protein [Tanacetum cinerariifolium]